MEEGLFSQTIEFSDVSYQSARKETQESIFTVLSGLYNYFGADTSVELTIANTPIPHDEIGNKRFFEHLVGEDAPDRGRIQPHPERQDARGRLEPRAASLHHLHGGSRRR